MVSPRNGLRFSEPPLPSPTLLRLFDHWLRTIDINRGIWIGGFDDVGCSPTKSTRLPGLVQRQGPVRMKLGAGKASQDGVAHLHWMRLVSSLDAIIIARTCDRLINPGSRGGVFLGYLVVSSANLLAINFWLIYGIRKWTIIRLPVALGRSIDPYDQARSQEPRD